MIRDKGENDFPLESHRLLTLDFADGTQKIVMEKDDIMDAVEDGPIAAMNRRMYFNENLMDLFILGIIDHKKYIKLRKLFRTARGTEDRKLAVTMVEQLHEKHFK